MEIDDFFNKHFSVNDYVFQKQNSIVLSRCNPMFSMSSKFQAFYHQNTKELVISSHSSKGNINLRANRYTFEDLRCFMFYDDIKIFGFDGSSFFMIDIESEECKKIDTDFSAISKILKCPVDNNAFFSDENFTFLILDEVSSNLIKFELMTGTYDYANIACDVIDFDVNSQKVFILTQNCATINDLLLGKLVQNHEISLNKKLASYVSCTQNNYFVFHQNSIIEYNSEGEKVNKYANSRYIHSINCVSFQVDDYVYVYNPDGLSATSTTLLNSNYVNFLDNKLFYVDNQINISSESLIFSHETDPSYFVVEIGACDQKMNKVKTKIYNSLKNVQSRIKADQNKFKNGYVNGINLNIAPFDKDVKQFLLFFDEKVTEKDVHHSLQNIDLPINKVGSIEIKQCRSRNIFIELKDETAVKSAQEMKNIIKRIDHKCRIENQSKIFVVDSQYQETINRIASCLPVIINNLIIYDDPNDMQMLILSFPGSPCKGKFIEKSFFNPEIQYPKNNSSYMYSNGLLLKYKNAQDYKNALSTKFMRRDKKEYQILPLVDLNTLISMKKWNLVLNGVPFNTTKEEIYKLFLDYGQIYSIEITENRYFVQFIHERDANNAKNLNDIEIKNRKVTVHLNKSISKPPPKNGREFKFTTFKPNTNIKMDKTRQHQNDKSITKNDNKGNVKSDNKGNAKSDNKGNVKSDNKGNAKSDNKGNVKSDNKGNAKSDNKGNVKSDNKGNAKSDNKGNVKSDNKGNAKSDNKGNVQNNSKGNAKNDNKRNQSTNKGNNKSDSTSGECGNKGNYKSENKNGSQQDKKQLTIETVNKADVQNTVNNNHEQNDENSSQMPKLSKSQKKRMKQKAKKAQLEMQQKNNQSQFQYQPDQNQQQQNQNQQQENQNQQKQNHQGKQQQNKNQQQQNHQGKQQQNKNQQQQNKNQQHQQGKQQQQSKNDRTNAQYTSISVEKPKPEQITITKSSDQTGQLYYALILNHKACSEAEITKEFPVASTIEILPSIPNFGAGRPIIKIGFSEQDKKKNFLKFQANIASDGIRLLLVDGDQIEQANVAVKAARKKMEKNMLRISGISKEVSEGDVFASMRNVYKMPIEYFEIVPDNNNQDFVMCDIGLKKEAMNKGLREFSNIKINGHDVNVDPYSQWVQDHS